MGIAAEEDHLLCCTNDGEVYAWVSNGFAQLGHKVGRGGSMDHDNDALAD